MNRTDDKLVYDSIGYLMNFFTVKNSTVFMESVVYMPQNTRALVDKALDDSAKKESGKDEPRDTSVF